MAIPDSIVYAGIGRQSAKGVGAPPTFGFGVIDSRVAHWTLQQAILELTNANPGFDTAERKSLIPGAILHTTSYAQLVGLLGFGILGADVVTGATPKLHTETAANDPIPYFTVWVRFFDQYACIIDCKVDQLSFVFGDAGNLDLSATLIGCQEFLNQGSRAPTDVATTITSPNITSPALALFTQADVGRPISGAGIPANTYIGTVTPAVSPATNSAATLVAADRITPVNATASATVTATIAPWVAVTDLSAQPYFAGAGATFLMDAASATPTAAKVKSGKIDLKRNLGAVLLASQVRPDDVVAGQPEAHAELTLIPADLTQLYKMATGTSTGTQFSTTPQYGSVDLTFTYDTNTSVEFQLLKVDWSAEWPEAKPKGGATELLFVGDAMRGVANICTMLVRNTIAAY